MRNQTGAGDAGEGRRLTAGEMVTLTLPLSPQDAAVYRAAFLAQLHRRRGTGDIGTTRRLKSPMSAEEAAIRALVSHQRAGRLALQSQEAGEL